jgi:hypothetical protein
MKDPQKNVIQLHGLPLIASAFKIFEKGAWLFARHLDNRHDYPPYIHTSESSSAIATIPGRERGDFSASR